MFNQWWWSSGAEANDSGVEIKNSLRFRGAQYLERTSTANGNRKTWTWSLG